VGGLADERRNSCLGFDRDLSWRGAVGEDGRDDVARPLMACSSFCSLSFANFSSTFLIAESVSTGRAAPKGFDFDLCSSVEAGFSGACSLRGKRFNFLRWMMGEPACAGDTVGGASRRAVNGTLKVTVLSERDKGAPGFEDLQTPVSAGVSRDGDRLAAL